MDKYLAGDDETVDDTQETQARKRYVLEIPAEMSI